MHLKCGLEKLLSTFILEHNFNRIFIYRDYIHTSEHIYMHLMNCESHTMIYFYCHSQDDCTV